MKSTCIALLASVLIVLGLAGVAAHFGNYNIRILTSVRDTRWSVGETKGPFSRRFILGQLVRGIDPNHAVKDLPGPNPWANQSFTPSELLVLQQSGWPLYWLSGSMELRNGQWSGSSMYWFSFRNQSVLLPLRVSPLNLLLNIALFVPIVFIARRAALGILARRRRRLGRCVACGYPVTGFSKCSECGAKVQRITVESVTVE